MAKRKSKARQKKKDVIVIDESKGLIFESEDLLYAYFEPILKYLEADYQKRLLPSDFSEEEQVVLEKYLEDTLDQPDQIWKEEGSGFEFPIYFFIKRISQEPGFVVSIAICYVDQDEHVPTFVFDHFATRDENMVAFYQKSELVFDSRVEGLRDVSVDGDALGDGDELAFGLFSSMIVIRNDKDIPRKDFLTYAELREESIEHPDEIWKKTDSEGHNLVTFIKEFPEHTVKNLYYVSVTLEEPQSQVHTLLFSFPTIDESLVDRYRQGENLQADEVVQESSH